MSNNWYPLSALTGGGTGALDSLDGAALLDGDRAIVITTTIVYFYLLDDDSGAAEVSPNIISPDTNPSTKRWILVSSMPVMFGYDDTVLTLAPVATATKAVCIGESNSVSGTGNSCAILSGESNIVINSTDSTVVGGDTNNINASNYSVIGGGENNTVQVTSYDSSILGGSGNLIDADSNYSIIGGGTSNIVTDADNSVVVGGESNSVDGSDYSSVLGGYTNVIDTASYYSAIVAGEDNAIDTSSDNSFIGSGDSNQITGGENGVIVGGYNNIVSVFGGSILGGSDASAHIESMEAAAYGSFATQGDSQRSVLQVRAATADATPKAVGISGLTTPYILVPASTAWFFKISAVVHEAATGDSAYWNISGGIKRDGSNNTALIGTVTGHGTPGANDRDAGAATWDLTITADDTNEALLLTATGEAAHTLKWTAKIELVEVR